MALCQIWRSHRAPGQIRGYPGGVQAVPYTASGRNQQSTMSGSRWCCRPSSYDPLHVHDDCNVNKVYARAIGFRSFCDGMHFGK